MKYFFEVIFDYPHHYHMLVRASDVNEAGNKALDALYTSNPMAINVEIIEIKRTEITEVIS